MDISLARKPKALRAWALYMKYVYLYICLYIVFNPTQPTTTAKEFEAPTAKSQLQQQKPHG